MMLWLNSCVGLLLPVAMVHIKCKHTLCCMQKITQKNVNNMLFLVTSIHFGIHNPVPSWYCRCCVGDWYKLLSVMHTHLLPTPRRSSQGVDQCECDGSWHSQKSSYRIISRTAQHVRGSTSSCSCAGGGWACVCMLNEVRGCCMVVTGLCTVCVHAGLNC